MNKNKFRGWNDVYRFTFAQSLKKTSLRLVTILVAVGLIAVLFAINIFRAMGSEDETSVAEPTSIEKVYVIDESGLNATDYTALIVSMQAKDFEAVQFEAVTGKTKEAVITEIPQEETRQVVAHITVKDGGYLLEIIQPQQSEVSSGECDALSDIMISCFESNKLVQVGLSQEQMTMVMTPSVVTTADIGEDTSLAAVLLKTLAPLVFGMLLYFMLLFYGQNITMEVSAEKTSKLMETLLTTIHPYALITGKVLAISSVAILQFIIWIVSVVVGLFGGNAVAQLINPEYSNSVVEIIQFVRDSLGQTAMSPAGIVLAIIIFCVGFFFYCVISSLFGCMVTKPDDAASLQGVAQFPIVISWLVTYLGVLAEKKALLSVARYIPFTAPFCVPIDLLNGTMSVGQGIISAVILIVFSLFVIMIAGRIYKGLVLYNGQKLSFKKIVNIVRNNTN